MVPKIASSYNYTLPILTVQPNIWTFVHLDICAFVRMLMNIYVSYNSMVPILASSYIYILPILTIESKVDC